MTLILFLYATIVAWANTTTHTVAVFEFQNTTEISQDAIYSLSDQARSAILKVLNDRVTVVTRENIDQLIKDQGNDFFSTMGTNEIDTGRKLNATHVVTGQVTSIDGVYVLTVNMYQTSNANLVSTTTVQASEQIELYNRSFEKIKVMMASTFLSDDSAAIISKSEQLVKVETPIVDPNLSGLAKLMWEDEQWKALDAKFLEIQKAQTDEWRVKSAKAWASLQPYISSDRSRDFINEFLSEFANIEVKVQYIDPSTQLETVKVIPIVLPEVIVARRYMMDLGYKEKRIEKGVYKKGCSLAKQSQCDTDELPVRSVTIDRNLSVMTTEVSQALFLETMEYNPSAFTNCGDDCPVNQVSWYEAAEFANALSEKEGFELCYSKDDIDTQSSSFNSCNGWRIPTDDEWEFIAQTVKGSGLLSGWHLGNSGNTIHESCSKQKVHGLCDVLGNISEWTGIPAGPSIARGGNWQTPLAVFRVSYKANAGKDTRSNLIGIRLVRTIE